MELLKKRKYVIRFTYLLSSIQISCSGIASINDRTILSHQQCCCPLDKTLYNLLIDSRSKE